MPKYLDSTGLGYFWSKVKNYINNAITDTTYSTMTQAQASAGTDTEGKLISPKVLSDTIGSNVKIIVEDNKIKFISKEGGGS